MSEPMFITMGANDSASVGIVANKCEKGYELIFYELENNKYVIGEKNFSSGDVAKQYLTIRFEKKQSLSAMIEILQLVKNEWDSELKEKEGKTE